MLTQFSINLMYFLTFFKIEKSNRHLASQLDIKGRVCANINKSSSDKDKITRICDSRLPKHTKPTYFLPSRPKALNKSKSFVSTTNIY